MESRSEYPTVAVVIPALNEAPSIARVLGDLPPVGRVIVVDNGSTDNTAEIARSCGADVVREDRRGYGQACQTGIAEALAPRIGRRPAVIVILDADAADDATLLGQLVEPVLNDQADLVVSDRTSMADSGALLPHQRLGNELAIRLIHRTTGHRYRDMGPFRAIRAESLERLALVDRNYGWNVEMQMKAVQAGLRIAEKPMPYRARVGVSKISGTVRGTIGAGVKIIWSVWRYR